MTPTNLQFLSRGVKGIRYPCMQEFVVFFSFDTILSFKCFFSLSLF